MASPQKLRLLPGLLGGSLPLGLQASFACLLLMWLGGIDGLSRTLGLAGRSIHLMVLISVGSMLMLVLVLAVLAMGRNVPTVVPVVLATAPWLVGISGALMGVRNVMRTVGNVPEEQQLSLLMQGTGELLCARLLGAWLSVALLLATAVALFIAGRSRQDLGPEPTGPKAGDRILEAVVPLLLASVCALAAVESKSLSDMLVAVNTVTPADQATILAAVTQELRTPPVLRTLALVGLVLALLLLMARRLMQKPRDTSGFLSRAFLALVVAGVLWADGRPLARMSEAFEVLLSARPPPGSQRP